MKTIIMEIEFTYDNKMMHTDDVESIAWFHNLLDTATFIVNEPEEIGDDIGQFKVRKWNYNADNKKVR